MVYQNRSAYLRNDSAGTITLGSVSIPAGEMYLIWDTIRYESGVIDDFAQVVDNIAVFNENIGSGDLVMVLGDTSTITTDEFYATTLDSKWTFVDAVGDSSLDLPGGTVNIVVPGGTDHDLWVAPDNTAPRILQSHDDTDFIAEVRFTSLPDTQYELQGIISQESTTKFVRTGIYYDGTSLKAFAAAIDGSGNSVYANVSISATSSVSVKIFRNGNNWKFYYATDDGTFTEAADFTFSLTVNNIGIYAGNDGTSTSFTGIADYFIGSATEDLTVQGAFDQFQEFLDIYNQTSVSEQGFSALRLDSEATEGLLIDHNNLLNNNQDVHPQYVTTDGSNPITGDINLDGYDLYGGTVDGYDLSVIYNAQKDPSGFPDRTTSTISVDDSTRTFSIAPVSGSYEIFLSGLKVEKTTTESVVFADTEGIHFFWFDKDGVLQTSLLSSDFENAIGGNAATIAAVYWDATNNQTIFLGEERHGLMDNKAHIHFHLSFGAQWYSGGALGDIVADGDGSSATHAQFSVSTANYADEDIIYEISNGSPQALDLPAEIPIYYRSGTNGDWRKKTADTYPLIYSGTAGFTGTSGRAPYNEYTGTTWQLTTVDNNDYFLVHYFGGNDINEPIFGIQGQNTYQNAGDARTGAETEIANLAGTAQLLSQEFVRLGTVIFQTANGFSNVPQVIIVSTNDGNDYIDFRGASVRGVGASVSDHGNLSGLTDDDHLQYLLVDGTRAMTGSLDMGTNNITNVGTVDGVDVSNHSARHENGGADEISVAGLSGLLADAQTPLSHASNHISGASDEIDGDQLDIDWDPTNYTPATTPAEVTSVDHLTAHLYGIDQALGGFGDVTGPGSSTDNALVRWDGTGGDTVQNSGWTLSDADRLEAGGDLDLNNNDILGVNSITIDGENIEAVQVDDGGTNRRMFGFRNSDQTLFIGADNAINGTDRHKYEAITQMIWEISGSAKITVTATTTTFGNPLDMGTNNITNVGTVDGVDVSAHASRHILGGADEIDGDELDIDFTPSNYTPTTGTPGSNVDHLAAHLRGIDNAITGGTGDVTGPGSATDNAITRFDGTTGKIIQNSSVTIDDSGNMDLGSGNITTSGTVDGVDVSDHSARHNPGGADALSTASAVTLSGSNAEGSAASFARSDHNHALGGTVGGDLSGTLPNPTVTDLTITGEEQGSILYFDGTNWVQLPPGDDGYILQSTGSGSDPEWAPNYDVVADIYNAAGGGSIDTTPVYVPFDSQRSITSGSFSHSVTTSNTELTINEDGVYRVTAQVGTNIASGSTRSASEMWVEADTGSGFSEIAGTRGIMYNRERSEGGTHATRSFRLTASAGDKLRVGVQRISSSTTLTLQANNSSLLVEKIGGTQTLTISLDSPTSPSTTTANSIAIWGDSTGDTLLDSTVIISSDNQITGVAYMEADNGSGGTLPTTGAIRLTDGGDNGISFFDGSANIEYLSGQNRLVLESTRVTIQSTDFQLDTPTVFFDSTEVNPIIYQDTESGSVSSDSLTLQAQNNSTASSTGGDLVITSGTGTTESGDTILQAGGVAALIVDDSTATSLAAASNGYLAAYNSTNNAIEYVDPSTVGVTDHGNLAGLSDDDHAQYLLVDGTRAMTGSLDMGTNAITNVGNVDGRDVSADGSTLDSHVANTSNPHSTDIGNLGSGTLAELNSIVTDATLGGLTSTAPVNVERNTAQVGTSTEVARSDHRHDIETAVPSALTVGQSQSEGISNSLARADHDHQVVAGTPVAVGDANATGALNSFVRADHVHALGGSVGGDLFGTLPNPSVIDLSISGEEQGSVLYFSGLAWVQLSPGTSGQFLQTQGTGADPQWATPTGSGDVSGPGSSTDNALVRWNGTSGDTIQNSGWTLSDAEALNAAGTLAMGSNAITTSSTVDGRDVSADGSTLDSHVANTSNPHSTDIGNLGSGTLAELNAAVTDATLDDSGDPRTPTAHASTHISGGTDEINGDQLDIDWNPSNYNPITSPTEVSSADHLTAHLAGIDAFVGTASSHISSSSNPHNTTLAILNDTNISTPAWGELLYRGSTLWQQLAVGTSGQVLSTQGSNNPPQWVNTGGLDEDAIHDNVSGEINGITEKASPVSADLLIIEDSEASNAKKKVQIGNLPSSGSGGGAIGVQSYPIGVTDDLTINIEQNDAIWGSLIIPLIDVTVDTLQCQVTQAAGSGNVYFAIYDSSFNKLGEDTTGVSCTSTGLKSSTLTSSVSLTAGTVYYLCLRSDANGSRFSGHSSTANSATPQFSIRKDNAAASSFPSSFSSPASNSSTVWVNAYSSS